MMEATIGAFATAVRTGGLSRFHSGLFVTTGLQAIALLLTATASLAENRIENAGAGTKVCESNTVGITLPSGFCATMFADNIGHARHLVVALNGDVYVNTWSGQHYGNDKPPAGGFLVALKDTDGDGRADVTVRFGPDAESGNAGGTGIAIYNGALYAETNDKIVKYTLPRRTAPAEIVVSGLPLGGDHPMHPFAIDAQGALYVNVGSATNACQSQNRILHSVGMQPCVELEIRAGIWRYDANRAVQHFSSAGRFVTGLRNAGGLAIDSAGRPFAIQHGRDQLRENWPEKYKPETGANEPAEELVQLEQGADFGWPYCYFDSAQKKMVLAPEYGGDGTVAGQCASKRTPVATFPAHWAPLDLVFYKGGWFKGEGFPSAYRDGAFIAFHGSWNRAPFAQGCYNIVFQPFANGKPSGPYVVFADGFAGAVRDPGEAAHRPSGLAAGPDGSLYISDDQHGRIWRITYQGSMTAPITAAPAPEPITNATVVASPRGGMHPDAGSPVPLAAPAGSTAAEVALGQRIFHGEVGGATCTGCHGKNAQGSPLGPNLTDGRWLWGDGSLESIARTIINGVSNSREYSNPMPPLGGAQLTPSQVSATAAYVWALSHPGTH